MFLAKNAFWLENVIKFRKKKYSPDLRKMMQIGATNGDQYCHLFNHWSVLHSGPFTLSLIRQPGEMIQEERAGEEI